MKKKQFEPLIISEFEENNFHLPLHSQNYYEIVFIKKGTGKHVINKLEIPYETGDIFLIGPNDQHYFEVDKRTAFFFILFTDTYFLQKPSKSTDYPWIMEMMNGKVFKEHKLSLSSMDKKITKHLFAAIQIYNAHNNSLSSIWLYNQVISILNYIKELASKQLLPEIKALQFEISLPTYIQQHIYEPEKLKIETLAKQFNVSLSYFSNYFKRNFGTSLRAYITAYRIELIESRLKIPNYNIKQIANDLGFLDESHLSHYYKRIKGFSLKQYRDKKRLE